MHCLLFFLHNKRTAFTYFFVCLLLSATANAEQVIQLYPGKAPVSEKWNGNEQAHFKNMFNCRVVYNVVQPTLTAYVANASIAKGTAWIIAPGVAFHTPSIANEEIDVARWLNAKSVAAFV